MRILGIDASLRSTGYGLVQVHGNTLEALAYGQIHNPAKLLPSRCLVRIADEITTLIAQHDPEVVAVEGLTFVQNQQIALKMGQARGAAILAAARVGLPIYEYAPRKVKQAVVGVGSAQKKQVGTMVKALLGLKEIPQEDAADALAIALCHAQNCRNVISAPEQI
jgi:crossover junction endodeoxyribonuclease RuvC